MYTDKIKNLNFTYRGWKISLDDAIKLHIVKQDEYGHFWYKMTGNHEGIIQIDIHGEKIETTGNQGNIIKTE